MLFLASLVAQAFVGHAHFNHEQVAHHDEAISSGTFVTSSHFWVDVMENWQSEYLQFALFILATVWLIQRGSTESKEPGKEGGESDEQQRLGKHADRNSPAWAKTGGRRTLVYSNSLVGLMVLIWLGHTAWMGSGTTPRNDSRGLGLRLPLIQQLADQVAVRHAAATPARSSGCASASTGRPARKVTHAMLAPLSSR